MCAALVGAAVGGATAVVDATGRPWQVGDFRPDRERATGEAGGTVEVGETTHDFGTVGTGGTGSHAFTVRNVGGGPLRLTRGATSCTCTIADFEQAEGGEGDRLTLAPGATTQVRLEWKGKGPGGPFRQQATIHTDDPRRPEVVFVVEGTVVPSWKAVPEAVQVSRVSATAGGRAEVQVFTYGEGPADVASVAIDHERAGLFRLSTEPLDAATIAAEAGATGGVRLVVDMEPGLPLGRLRAMITLIVRLPEEVTVEIPVEGTVTGDLLVAGAHWDRTRQALLLGTISGQKGLRTDLFVTARGPHRDEFRPTVREVVPDTLEVQVGEPTPVGSGAVVRVPLTIVIPPGSRPVNHLCSQQATAGRIVLETGHPEIPELTIPVCVAIGP